MLRLTLLLLPIFSVASSSVSAPVRPSAEILDYLIQDVCRNASGKPIRGDPASCSSHSNLRPGEPVPYLLTDSDRAKSLAFESVTSIPVLGVDGELMVLTVKSLQGGFDRTYRFQFSAERDGFDLIDVSHSRFASIVRTSDPGCADQLLSPTQRTVSLSDRAGGWILFPSVPTSQWRLTSTKVTTWRTQLSPKPLSCRTNHAAGFTMWFGPKIRSFESGKALMTIQSDHVAAEDLTARENSFESFYFTREYGLTRWESWWTEAYCQKTLGSTSPRCQSDLRNPLNSRCRMEQLQPTFGDQRWVRMDCRDHTNYVPLTQPQLPLTPTLANANRVKDINYQRTVEAR